MAKIGGNPQNLITPPKGVSMNPLGRPKLTEIERAARDAERSEIAELWPIIKKKSLDELKELRKDGSQPAIKLAMVSALMLGIEKGDLSEIHRFYDRLLGKPKQEFYADINSTVTETIPDEFKKEFRDYLISKSNAKS